MTGVAYSSRWTLAALLGLSAALCGGFARHITLERREARLAESISQEHRVELLISELPNCKESDLAALRKKVTRFHAQLGSEGLWNHVIALFASGWIVNSSQPERMTGYSVQEGTMVMISPCTSDWTAITRMIVAVEKMSGVQVIKFAMNTSGDKERRSVDLVELKLLIETRW